MRKLLVIFCASHRVIFSLRESDIETYGFSDIIFAFKTREANITWTLVQISLRSNITRRKANITKKDLMKLHQVFFVLASTYFPRQLPAKYLQRK